MTREEWKVLVIEWIASGQSAAEFAKSRDIRPKQLSWWKWRLTTDGEDLQRPLPVPFVELTFETATAAPVVHERIELEVGRVQVRLPDDFQAGTLAYSA